MWNLDAIQEEHRCIMALISKVRQYLQLGHLPFPLACHPVPPPAQPRGTSHDGAGPSCTHPEDSEENSKDDEGEYKYSK